MYQAVEQRYHLSLPPPPLEMAAAEWQHRVRHLRTAVRWCTDGKGRSVTSEASRRPAPHRGHSPLIDAHGAEGGQLFFGKSCGLQHLSRACRRENMRMPFATSTYASFCGVVTMTAAENATVWHLQYTHACRPSEPEQLGKACRMSEGDQPQLAASSTPPSGTCTHAHAGCKTESSL